MSQDVIVERWVSRRDGGEGIFLRGRRTALQQAGWLDAFPAYLPTAGEAARGATQAGIRHRPQNHPRNGALLRVWFTYDREHPGSGGVRQLRLHGRWTAADFRELVKTASPEVRAIDLSPGAHRCNGKRWSRPVLSPTWAAGSGGGAVSA